jgi:formylglycine-generating enzyme required for sulfatase activity
MIAIRTISLVLGLLILGVSCQHVDADTFGSDPNTMFEIEFVPIGNPGNPADTTGYPRPAGSVPYVYRIGKYEISEQMIDKANAQSAAEGTPLNIDIHPSDRNGPHKPVVDINWYKAARFVNWLNTNTGHAPAYKFIGSGFYVWEPSDPGFDPNNLYRNRLAKYVLVSSDEWYKAAYYDPNTGDYFDYPTGSNSVPSNDLIDPDPGNNANFFQSGYAIGSPYYRTEVGEFENSASPYGTFDQGGNVWEWNEAILGNFTRSIRGGGYADSRSTINYDEGMRASVRNYLITPGSERNDVGFRVASVPEPTTYALALAALCLALGRRRSC